MYLSPTSIVNRIARARIGRGGVVRFPDSSLPNRYRSQSTGRWKSGRSDNSCALFADEDAHGGFRVYPRRDPSAWKEKHREICLLLGIEPWKPEPKKPQKPQKASLQTVQILGESIRICLDQGAN